MQGELQKAGTVQLGEAKVQADLLHTHTNPKRSQKEDRARLLSGVSSQDKKQWAQIKYRKFQLNMRKLLSIMRAFKHRNRLPREAVWFPSLDILKLHLDMALSNLLYLSLL